MSLRLSLSLRSGLAVLAAFAAFAATATPAVASHNNATRWAPFSKGDVWVLRDAQTGTAKEVRCDYDYGSLSYVSGLFGQNLWFGYSNSSKTNLYVWNSAASKWSYFARFGVTALGRTWSVSLDNGCGQFKAHWQASGVKVVTAAGTFYGCRQLDFTVNPPANVRCAKPEIGSIFFAPEVGIVKIVGTNSDTYELESALVGGKQYPAPSQSTGNATLTLDKPSYVNQPNTIRCIRAPCPSNEVTAQAQVTLAVTNSTSAPVTYTFSSGQKFDFEVVDQSGNVVLAWSDGRAFTMAITTETLAAGETKTFQGTLELKDRNGQQLDGTYTVRGYLTLASWAQPALQAPSASARLAVSIIQP